jgi:hypothetical protein
MDTMFSYSSGSRIKKKLNCMKFSPWYIRALIPQLLEDVHY